MIVLRVRQDDLAQDWTNITFDGEDERELSTRMLSALVRTEWEVLVSRDGDCFEPFESDDA